MTDQIAAVNRLLGLNRPNPEPRNENLTAGEWDTETESCAAFDELVERSEMFDIRREVRGYYLQLRIGQQDKEPRIDRILLPRQELLNAGWQLGPIGVECKRSQTKIGPAIAQLQDYSRAAWQIRPGYWIVPQWFFLWPMHFQHSAIASVLSQSRLGGITTSRHPALFTLTTGSLPAIATFFSGQVEIRSIPRNGNKTGSR